MIRPCDLRDSCAYFIIDRRQADAEALPFPDDTFHLYTIAFGLRNVTDVRQQKTLLKDNHVFL